MTSVFDDRLDVERRLLAALIAWPLHLAKDAAALEPQHFTSSAHTELYAVVRELGKDLLEFPLDGRTVAQIAALIDRNDVGYLFRSVGGVAKYTNEVIESDVLETDIAELVAVVRTCPRCGK